jgi:Zn-dependent protease with chaperone function
MKHSLYTRSLALTLVVCFLVWETFAVTSGPTLPNPGDTGVSKQDQEKIGLQAMAEVYKQMPVLPDSSPETQYVRQLGQKLMSVIPSQYSWPYQFHVIQQKEINAFALPGGPVFINVGTITAADNEAELAGVMAHEMSHVYMQHSIKQMKKAHTTQGLAAILGGIAGALGGTVGSLARAGIGIGAGVITLKYSRTDEAQADHVGAIIMYKAGYNPKAMADFFQKLASQGGNPPQFLSDHPNPGNREEAIDQEIRDWPPKNYQVNSVAFQRAKQEAQSVRAYTAEQIAQGAKSGEWSRYNQQNRSIPANLPAAPSDTQGGGSAQNGNGGASLANVSYSQVRPSGNFRTTQNNFFSMSYPENWQVFNDPNGAGMTIGPPAGVSHGNVAYGVVVNGGQNQNAQSLDQAMSDLVQSMQQANPDLRSIGSPQRITVSGTQGRSVDLTGNSPVMSNGRPLRERDWLVMLPNRSQQNSFIYFVFVAPENDFDQLRPTYERMLKSVRLQ